MKKQAAQMEVIGSPVAEIQISYSTNVRPSDRKQIRGSRDAEEILREVWEPGTMELYECFYTILLNRANRVIGVYRVSQGGMAGTVVDSKLVFSVALKAAAAAIILAHNHPSGQTRPSEADLSLTKKLVEGGKILDIPVLDHLIITEHTYLSFADEGML